MIEDTLQIIEPLEVLRKSRPGSIKVVEYKIKNIGDFDLISLDLDVYTIKKVGYDKSNEPIFRKTSKNYAEVVDTPKIIRPGKTEIVKVQIDVPPTYRETVKTAEGKSIRTPFRVHFGVHALEDIKEI